jgi:hypothetical protein
MDLGRAAAPDFSFYRKVYAFHFISAAKLNWWLDMRFTFIMGHHKNQFPSALMPAMSNRGTCSI